jgi:hypothetical protein
MTKLFAVALVALALAGCGEESVDEMFDRCVLHDGHCTAREMAWLSQIYDK